jgi:hypothetical protein
MGGVGDLVGEERAAAAAAVRKVGDALFIEEAVDDQLTPTFEDVKQADPSIGAFEPVFLLDRHSRHSPPLGGEGITGAGQLLLLDQQLLASGLPLVGRDDRRHLHGLPPSMQDGLCLWH